MAVGRDLFQKFADLRVYNVLSLPKTSLCLVLWVHCRDVNLWRLWHCHHDSDQCYVFFKESHRIPRFWCRFHHAEAHDDDVRIIQVSRERIVLRILPLKRARLRWGAYQSAAGGAVYVDFESILEQALQGGSVARLRDNGVPNQCNDRKRRWRSRRWR